MPKLRLEVGGWGDAGVKLHLGLTYVELFFCKRWLRRPGRKGPDRFGDSTIRAYWAGPVALLVLT